MPLQLLQIIAAPCELIVLGLVCYAWAGVLLGLFSGARADPAPGAAGVCPHFTVLVPARNEEAVLGGLLASLAAQDYPAQVLVVADNSSDGTAAVARALGALCHERETGGESTKGAALAWLWERAIAAGELTPGTVAVVLDADCCVEPGFLRALAHSFGAGALAVQCHRAVMLENATPLTWLEAAGEELRQRQARTRRLLGTSVFLHGSGMAFEGELFGQLLALPQKGLAEDMAWQAWLVEHGVPILWCPDAKLCYEAVGSLAAFHRQRRRWIGARMRGGLREGLGGAWGAIASADLSRLDHALWRLQPPRSMLLACVAVLAAVAWRWPEASLVGAAAWGLVFAGFGLYALLGFACLGLPLECYAGLLLLPVVVARINWLAIRAVVAGEPACWEPIAHGSQKRPS